MDKFDFRGMKNPVCYYEMLSISGKEVPYGVPPTQGPDLTFNLVQVLSLLSTRMGKFVPEWAHLCWTMAPINSIKSGPF